MFSNFLPDFLKKSLEAVAMATDTQQKESTINYMFLCDNTQTEKVWKKSETKRAEPPM